MKAYASKDLWVKVGRHTHDFQLISPEDVEREAVMRILPESD